MTLADYLSRTEMTDAAFAALVAVDRATINRVRRGLSDASVELAMRIEAETGGQVRGETLSSAVRLVRAAAPADPTVHTVQDAA